MRWDSGIFLRDAQHFQGRRCSWPDVASLFTRSSFSTLWALWFLSHTAANRGWLHFLTSLPFNHSWNGGCKHVWTLIPSALVRRCNADNRPPESRWARQLVPGEPALDLAVDCGEVCICSQIFFLKRSQMFVLQDYADAIPQLCICVFFFFQGTLFYHEKMVWCPLCVWICRFC